MLTFFKSVPPILDSDQLFFEPYQVDFSLSRLVPGVDNVRYDVRLSPELIKSAGKMIQCLIAEQTQSLRIVDPDLKLSLYELQNEFQEHYCQVLLGAVNQAKMQKEVQIDFLAQTAVVKLILTEIRSRYELLIESFIKEIRKLELSPSKDLGNIIRLKEQLSKIRSGKASIIRNAGIEIFQQLSRIQKERIQEIREINFGPDISACADIFSNPLLHVEDSHDDFFMMEEYRILLGRRFDDPDQSPSPSTNSNRSLFASS